MLCLCVYNLFIKFERFAISETIIFKMQVSNGRSFTLSQCNVLLLQSSTFQTQHHGVHQANREEIPRRKSSAQTACYLGRASRSMMQNLGVIDFVQVPLSYAKSANIKRKMKYSFQMLRFSALSATILKVIYQVCALKKVLLLCCSTVRKNFSCICLKRPRLRRYTQSA